jgi:hypothetical protein
VSRRPPLPGAPRILRCHEEGGGERAAEPVNLGETGQPGIC